MIARATRRIESRQRSRRPSVSYIGVSDAAGTRRAAAPGSSVRELSAAVVVFRYADCHVAYKYTLSYPLLTRYARSSDAISVSGTFLPPTDLLEF